MGSEEGAERAAPVPVVVPACLHIEKGRQPWGEEGTEGNLPGRDPPRGGGEKEAALGAALSSAPVREFVHLCAVPAG